MKIDYAFSREKRPDFKYRLRRRTQEVIKAIEKYAPSPQKIIDLGTAEGKMLQEIKRRYPSSLCLGIDHSYPLLLYGKKKYPGIHLICADVQNLSFLKSGGADLIIATAVIEHLASPKGMLQESYRLLKKGGIILLTSPHPIWERISRVLGLIRGDHCSVLKPKEILSLCRAEKFNILKHFGFMISPVGMWGEQKIEKALQENALDAFLPNHFVVAQK